MKFIGVLLMFFSALALDHGFTFSLLGWFLFGLFLVGSREIVGHFFFIEREKVRAKYRRQR